MDATATPRGTPARVIARDNSTFPRSLRPSTVFVDSVLVKPAPHTATRLACTVMAHGYRSMVGVMACSLHVSSLHTFARATRKFPFPPKFLGNISGNKAFRAEIYYRKYAIKSEEIRVWANWHGLQMQRLSVVLHTAVAWQTVNELACGESGIVHGAECIAVLNGVA